ncbi:MAG: DUF2075 domain-containing protein [Rubrivivax sp.]
MPTRPNEVQIYRWMYAESLAGFLQADPAAILGALLQHSQGAVEPTQRDAWVRQIDILQACHWPPGVIAHARIYFEFTVPRLGRRVDTVLLTDRGLVLVEFKVGEAGFTRSAIDQVWDYGLDFKHFHEASHAIAILPVLVATQAPAQVLEIGTSFSGDGLARPLCAAPAQLPEIVNAVHDRIDAPAIDADAWERGRYLPTPTIVEAARALYAGHAVAEISRSDAGARNLAHTTAVLDRVIEQSRQQGRKSICFVTGVPGAGKTLVGLDVANRHLDRASETYSVFLSGNGPLVAVLREALARDRVQRAVTQGRVVRVGHARREVETFIQNVHHFRDEYLRDPGAPPEHVVLFDEAQRAWDLQQTSAFMKRKRGRADFAQSEPEFLVSCMDRHLDWAVVVCLVGSGQEINTGEGGIAQWFEAVLGRFGGWDVHLSSQLTAAEYHGDAVFDRLLARPNTFRHPDLHLATSMRSFRAETLSQFVRELLDLELAEARGTLAGLTDRYPIVLTRDLDAAKRWLRGQARGSERFGVVVSSQAERLKPLAIDIRVKTDPVKWFLDGKDDTRSSYYLEDVATEFQVQGLELDWACVVWDGDLRFAETAWAHHEFRGSRWTRIQKPERRRYLENAYRVLLTRARQGMVIVVPEGSADDSTRQRLFYDPTFEYLQALGMRAL